MGVIYYLLVLLLPGLASCTDTSNTDGPRVIKVDQTFFFVDEAHLWETAFVDYPVDGDMQVYRLDWRVSELPLRENQNGLRVQFNNASDDVFAYAFKQFEGLKPHADYDVIVEVTVYTPFSKDIGGIGGSPGVSNRVKVGAVAEKPDRIYVSVGDSKHWRISIDKGNQAQDGKDMISVGSLYNGVDSDQLIWTSITLKNLSPHRVRSSSDGDIWTITGIDSGFEGFTEVYFEKIRVTIQEAM